jgi:23S rRNA (cytosine1962-C5)-methyltransferase
MQPLIEKIITLNNRIDDMSGIVDGIVDSYRVFHGRGKCYPGFEFVTLDYFHPVLFMTLFHQPPDYWLNECLSILKENLSGKIQTIVVQHRYLPGDPSEIVYGELPEQVFAKRGELKFQLNLGKHQNIGFFLDIEPARLWLEQHTAHKRVLNLFAYTCSFSVIAVAAGAEKVVNVDMSSAALNQGRANHLLNNLDKSRSQFLAEDILKSWGRIKRSGPYDLVIFDPPSFQKGSFDSEKDYLKLVRRLPELMPSGGLVLSCLNNPNLPPDFLMDVFRSGCTEAKFLHSLSPHSDFPDAEPERQLKMLVFSLP